VGRRFGYALLLRYGSYVHLNTARIKIGQYLFLRYGSKVVFFARFVPVLRSVRRLPCRRELHALGSFWIANVAGAAAGSQWTAWRPTTSERKSQNWPVRSE